MPPTPKLPRYVERTRAKGRDYYYLRYKGKRLTKLRGDPETPEFYEDYADWMRRLATDNKPGEVRHGSLRWLIAEYKGSPEFKALATKTQRDYGREMDRLSTIDSFPAADIRRPHIRKIRDALVGKHRAQKLFTQVCSVLFNFGISELDIEMTNPAQRMKRVGEAESYIAWSDEEMAKFEASKPPIALLTAYFIARYTGPRRSDAVSLMRSHYDGATLEIPNHKVRDDGDPIFVKVHKRLKEHLDQQPKTLYLIADEKGRPITPTRLTHAMREHLDTIGLPDRHLHGLRHAAGKALAEAGCSAHEIAAVLGHETLQMVENYTKKAAQKKMASAAITKLERNRNKT